MVNFEQLFRESGGKPIVYDGRPVCLVDEISLPTGFSLELAFESASGVYRQGVALKADGPLAVGAASSPHILLWRDTAPDSVVVHIGKGTTKVSVYNVWDHGDGVTQAWHNGAAMIVEHLDAGARRYRCNDGEPDDDFDDIVFRIRPLAA